MKFKNQGSQCVNAIKALDTQIVRAKLSSSLSQIWELEHSSEYSVCGYSVEKDACTLQGSFNRANHSGAVRVTNPRRQPGCSDSNAANPI